MSGRLAGKAAIVTGAGRGIGRAEALLLAAEGAHVTVNDVDADAAEVVVKEIVHAGGVAASNIDDVSTWSGAESAVEAVIEREGKLDVLVNNAGIGSWEHDRQIAARTIAVNYIGSRDVTDALVPLIPSGGRVVMVSSGLGELSYLGRDLRSRFADPSLTRSELESLVASYLKAVEAGEDKRAGWPSAYSVSKIALNALTRILARELSPQGIRVNSVCPGWVRTDMGGPRATRSVQVGARSIVLGAMLPADVTGGFFRDGKKISW